MQRQNEFVVLEVVPSKLVKTEIFMPFSNLTNHALK